MNGEAQTAIRDRLPSDTIEHVAMELGTFRHDGVKSAVATLTIAMANKHHETPYRLEWFMVHRLEAPMVLVLAALPPIKTITQGDIDMAKHYAREAFYLAPPSPSGDLRPLLERALSKMVECLKP